MINSIVAGVTHNITAYVDSHLQDIARRFDNAELALKRIEKQNASIDKRLLNLETNAAEV
jgi:hypothetical protein